MTKRLLNIFLILVIAVTILPIKQVGNMLFNNQWTEELADHADDLEKKNSPDKWTFLRSVTDLVNIDRQAISQSSNFFAFTQTLPFQPSDEIHAPPPNILQ